MTPLANIVSGREGDLLVARIHGELDASTTAWAGARLRGLLSNHSDALVVDLSGTTYLDSAGIALLFSLAAELRLRQQALYVVIAEGSSVARIVVLTGLDQTVPTHASLDVLHASLGTGA